MLTRIVWLLENSPPLLAAYLQRALSIEDRLARKLAEREGVDPDTDLRPFLAVGAVGTAPARRPLSSPGQAGEPGDRRLFRRSTAIDFHHASVDDPALVDYWAERRRKHNPAPAYAREPSGLA
ncbi:hypothetical protein [Streptomyces sp. UG1]|uniref:hypothetical protein n=1 Tax=Streptomyces sp. UG1 TaxID=3417652 RepID=UPI003CEFCA64